MNQPAATQNSLDYGLTFDHSKIQDIFSAKSCYIVPRYQRSYSWTSDEIEELLTDLSDAKRDFPDEAYLLGQVILCPSTTLNTRPDLPRRGIRQLDIIDGQQRITTLFVLQAVALRRLRKSAAEDHNFGAYEKQRISEWSSSLALYTTNNVLIPKVIPAQDGSEVLLPLIDSDLELISSGSSPTQEKLILAIEHIEKWYDNLTAQEAFESLEFLMDQVYFVTILLKTSAHALRVFQKVNNRGLELDNADLIKSFLFQHVTSDDDWQKIADAWDSASSTLLSASRGSLKNMENFMKMLIGIRTGMYVSKSKLYERWQEELEIDPESAEEKSVQRNKSELEKAGVRQVQVNSLVNTLRTNAKALVAISKSEVPINNHKTDFGMGLREAGFIQPVEVLLAGAHLSESSYLELLKIVEDRTMLSSWANEPKNQFEPIIHPWAHAVSKLDPHASSQEIRAASKKSLDRIEENLERAFLGVKSLSYSTKSHQKRIRYFLARVHRAFQSRFQVSSPSMSELMKTTNPSSSELGYDLDHIFPKSDAKAGLWVQNSELDEKHGAGSRYLQKIHSIGNLVLLHPHDNRLNGDDLPWQAEKLDSLSRSELILNRFLAPGEPLIGTRPSQNAIKEEVRKLGIPIIQSETWGEQQIDSLANFYWVILAAEIKKTLGYVES